MMNESIPVFPYEMYDVPKEKNKDVNIKIMKILLEVFDPITRLLIIDSLFNPKDFDVEEFAYKFREMKKK